MTKKYLVSEDEYIGQLVIICDTYEREIDVYVPTTDQINAAMYLYRELPKQMEMRTFYRVRVIMHYEDTYNHSDNCLFYETTTDKDKGNELFKQALLLCS